jgi:DNA-binding NarL/FixJ family response regulator
MKRILVIEDQPIVRRNLAFILEQEGFLPESAANGRVGVEAALRSPPDLVLCDIMMPELDGYGVLDALRADPRTASVPFIFLTAKGQRIDQRTGMECGADDYLTKPVVKDELVGAIQARLRRAQMQARLMEEKLRSIQFKPDFSSPIPLQALGLSPREAEVLAWVAQGKSNADTASILGMSELTVKKHLVHIYEKLGVESRNAATFRALEVLSRKTSDTAASAGGGSA